MPHPQHRPSTKPLTSIAHRMFVTVVLAVAWTMGGCSDPSDDPADTSAADAGNPGDSEGADANVADASGADVVDAAVTDAGPLDAKSTADGQATDATLSDAVTSTDEDTSGGADGEVADGGGDGGNDATDANTDALGKTCPGPKAPTKDTKVSPTPQPDITACKWGDPEFFKGAKPPKAELNVEMGQIIDGKFVALKDKQWIPMDHGIQGGFHITLAFRFKLPGVDEPILKVQAEPRLYDVCELTGFGNAPVVYPKPVDGYYQQGNKLNPGIQVRFGVPGASAGVKSSEVFTYCNEWYELRLAVRDMKSGKWGQAHLRVRTYDTKASGG